MGTVSRNRPSLWTSREPVGRVRKGQRIDMRAAKAVASPRRRWSIAIMGELVIMGPTHNERNVNSQLCLWIISRPFRSADWLMPWTARP